MAIVCDEGISILKRLLILGGGYAEIPLIKAGKELGFYVISTGNRPEDLGHQYADEFRLEDFSDREAILSLAKSLQIDAICAGCNDFAAISAAYVAERLKLPGHDPLEITELIHHKDSYRRFASEIGVPTPKARGCTSVAEALCCIKELKLPVLVKPVDLTGGKGISKVIDLVNVNQAVEDALSISKIKRVVLEEFIEGSRHGFSAILRSGKIVFYFVDDEHYHLSPYLVSGASVPTSCSSASIRQLVDQSEKIATELRLVDGIFHVQFIERAQGDPVIIEICRRAPGDLYVELVRHATGATYAEWIIRAAAGLDLSEVRQLPITRLLTRHCLMAKKPGFFAEFHFDQSLASSIIDRLLWARAGEVVRDPSVQKFGIVFVEHKNSAELQLRSALMQCLLLAKTHPD